MGKAGNPEEIVLAEEDGRFAIHIPANYVDVKEISKAIEYLQKCHQRGDEQPTIARKFRKILLVDDFATTRTLIANMLIDEEVCTGSGIVQARHGKEALAKLLQEKNFDFIISDWNMPEMTGYELLTEVRNNELLKALPFLMVTAEGDIKNVKMALKAGVSGYILKPFTPQKLKEKLQQMRLI